MEKEIIESLFHKYINNQCSPEEVDRLMELLERPENRDLEKDLVKLHLASDPVLVGSGDPLLRERLDGKLKDILDTIHAGQLSIDPSVAYPTIHPARLYLLRAVTAAVVILLLGSSAYFFFSGKPSTGITREVKRPVQHVDDVAPGGNKAVLTLGNGGRIVLDSSVNGVLAKQGTTRILKEGNGQLAYKANVGAESNEVSYNTLSTPPGGQYQLVLADGSKVWLDAASSISYPTAFTGSERRVTITGQAYFEIARNERLPFIVQKGKVSVRVLGTHFNVNAYDDEGVIRTTLLEGTVSVAEGSTKSILKPGQQMQVGQNGEFKLIDHADTEEAIAWKDGFFRFSHCDLPAVMRQLARWYDVEVVYQGKIPPLQFGGKMERDLNLSEVLEGLEKSLVHFKIENKKLIVMP